MKLGLLTDIHEHIDLLKVALARLERERVDRIVILGDTADLFCDHTHLEETCRVLRGVDAVGVWGNHDYNDCQTSAAEMAERFPPIVAEFFATLRPRLEIDGFLMTHVEPWLDTESMPDLWYFGKPDKNADERDHLFSKTTHRVMFGGHYHRWMHVTPDGNRPVSGTEFDLSKGRHFVVIGALCDGHFAVYDTTTCLLRPMSCASDFPHRTPRVTSPS